MRTALGAACAVVFALSVSPQARAQGVDPDLENCRGVNHVVSGRRNPIDQWLNYDATTVEHNLTSLDRFGVNALRVFSSFAVWRDPLERAQYVNDLEDLATRAFERDMLLMLVLFDSYGANPDNIPGWTLQSLAGTTGWFKSPELSYLPLSGHTEVAQFISDTMGAVAQAQTNAMGQGQVIYDMWNEPSPGVTGDIVHAIGLVKGVADERTTVGFAHVNGHDALFAQMADPSDLDVISFHPYGLYEQVIQAEALAARSYPGDRPIVASEAVSHGAGQDYAHILRRLEAEGVGFLAWEGFASQTMFKGVDGLFYEEPIAGGTVDVRDLEGVHTLLRMAIDDGFHPTATLATLRDSADPGYIGYYPTDYEFTVEESEDLMVNWADRYANETYSLTPYNAYLAGQAQSPPVFDTRPLDFYKRIQGWAKTSGNKLDPFDSTELANWNMLTAALNAAINATGAAIISNPAHPSLPVLFAGIDQAFQDRTDFLKTKWIVPFATPLENTAPVILYLKGWWETVLPPSGPPVAQIQFKVELLVNDADRLSDVEFVDVAYSPDGGENYTYFFLSTAQLTSTGYLSGTFNLPPLPPGQKYRIRGRVEDGESFDQMTKVVPGP